MTRAATIAAAAAGAVLVAAPAAADTLPPTVSPPLPRLYAPQQLSPDTTWVPARVYWRASDPDGVASTESQRSLDGVSYETFSQAFYHPPLVGVQQFALADYNPVGTQYFGFRALAADTAGNTSAAVQGPAFTVLPPLQEDSVRIEYAAATPGNPSPWRIASPRYAWGGSLASSRQAGSSASVSFTARSVAWVTTRGSLMGVARVYIDGELRRTIDLSAGVAERHRPRFIMAAFGWARVTSHRITVEVARGRVDVDAFLLLR